MATLYTNFINGTLSGGIGNSNTTIQSAAFVDLPVLSGADIMKIVIDPFGEFGTPEIIYATGHLAGNPEITGVLRGQDVGDNAGPARAHDVGTVVAHVPVASDWRAALTGLTNLYNSPGTLLATSGPPAIIAGGAQVVGTAASISRSDHRHALAAAPPGNSNPGDVAAEGASTAVARSDHVHGREAPVLTTKGDLLTRTAVGEVRVPVGAEFSVPVADPTHANGWRWAPANTGPLAGTRETLFDFGTVSGLITLNFAAANAWIINPNGAITIAFSNLPPAGQMTSGTLIFLNSTYSVTWPGTTKSPNGVDPVLNGETWLSIAARSTHVTVGPAWALVA
jgi:hypothetical protein